MYNLWEHDYSVNSIKVAYGSIAKLRNWDANIQMIFISIAITCPEKEAAKEEKGKENLSVSMDRLF